MDLVDRIKWVTALAPQSITNGAALRVGVVLADLLNGKTGQLNPSIGYLSERTGLSRWAVQDAIKNLRGLGAISLDRVGGGAPGTTHRFHLNPVENWSRGKVDPTGRANPTGRVQHTEGLGTVPKGVGSTLPEQTKQQTKEQKTSPKFSTTDFSLAKLQYQQLLELNPSHTKPNLEKWAAVFRLLRERDGRTETEIREMLAWVHRDKFWSGNILSPAKLREHWDRLVIQRGRNGQASAAGPDLRGAL